VLCSNSLLIVPQEVENRKYSFHPSRSDVPEHIRQTHGDEAHSNRGIPNMVQQDEPEDHAVDKDKGNGILMDEMGWIVVKSVDGVDIAHWA
jgi:hypothetical protein